MGIRGQLALLVGGLVALSAIGLGFGAAEQRHRDEIDDMRARSERVLEAVGVTVAVYVATNEVAGLDTLVAHVSERYPDLVELAVIDEEGRILAHSTPERFNTVAGDPFSRRAVESGEAVWAREGDTLWLGVPAVSGLRWATVVGAFSLERLEAAISAQRTKWYVGALSLGSILVLVLFLGLDRMVVRPLRALTLTAHRMGEGELDARVPRLKGRELSDLAESFNKMAGALKAERDNLERTVAERTRELAEANQRLEKLALTDGLTGAFNHRRFQEALAQEVLRASRSGQALSVLIADVDHFKRFNDTMGHPAGDELLRKLTATLSAELRTTDLLARYGGEEFAVILPDTGKVEALQVAERLRAAVEGQLNANAAWEQRVSISLGVASFGADGDGAQALIASADRALYAAKNRGRNQVAAAGMEAS